MNLKKMLSIALAMLLALGAVTALAETDDLQAQLDAANERIAQLEAEVELYKPYYDSQIVAEYGDDGVIWREDALAEYESEISYYSQFGLDVASFADDIKQSILEDKVKESVLDQKAEELGLTELDEQALADLQAEAEQAFENYIDTYRDYFNDEDTDDETARETTIAALASYGLTVEALTEQMQKSYVDEQLHAYVTKDVTVSDEEIQAAYEQMVADNESLYADSDYTYNSARNDGEVIAWNPEGYRAVKHVLIKFDDDQTARYNELKTTLDSLKDEKDAVENPAEETGEEADAEEAGDAGDAEEKAEPRSLEEIDADIARITAEIETLYNELLPQAQQVIDEFEAGADFDSLIEKYNADPGMTTEPTATNGYAVAADSETWDPAFTEGAMSIAEVGQISAPVYGTYGIHVIYYLSDIPAGAVPFEDIADAVEASALEEKTNQVYDDQVAAWVEEAHPVYHVDRF